MFEKHLIPYPISSYIATNVKIEKLEYWTEKKEKKN
jgi:hypothetical protein